jgi:hypothetical protein
MSLLLRLRPSAEIDAIGEVNEKLNGLCLESPPELRLKKTSLSLMNPHGAKVALQP